MTKPMDARLWRLLCGLDEEQTKGLSVGCGRVTIGRALDDGLIERYSPEGFPAVTYWRRTPLGEQLHQLEANTGRLYPAPWKRGERNGV